MRSSFSNRAECDIICDIICDMLAKIPLMKQQSIGVITFYLAQKALMTQMLKERKLEDVQCNTVDGYQGGEKDIIFISFVRKEKVTKFLTDSKRLNVALTRAKFYMFLVTNIFEGNEFWKFPLLSKLYQSFSKERIVKGFAKEVDMEYLTDLVENTLVISEKKQFESYVFPRNYSTGDFVCIRFDIYANF